MKIVAFPLLASFPFFALLTAACGDGASEVPAVEVTERDSAGIAIVENRMDTSSVRSGWAVGAEPRLVIGGIDAPEAQQLYGVGGGVRLDDGRIVIVDQGSAETRVYGPAGELLAAHGREGEGPGEFQRPTLAGLGPGDTLVVYDSNLRRVSLVHPVDGFVRSYPVGAEGGGYPVAIGVMEDGGLAVGGGMAFSSTEGFPSGAVRPTSRYAVLAPDGTVRGDLGDIPASEMFARSGGGNFIISRVPFGRSTQSAAVANHLWLGTADAWEILAYDEDAELERIVRFDRPLLPLTDELWGAALEERVADAEDAAAARSIRESFAAMPRPEVVPPYGDLDVDALGYVWIGEYQSPGEMRTTYTIVDREGRGVGRLTLPERTRPLYIGADYILALTQDELDLELVTLWDLERPATPPN